MNKDEIKDSLSMSSVIQSYGILVKRGMCSCPFHGGDKHPSMKVYPQSYYCFACGETGDIFTFVQKMDGCGFADAFRKLGGTYEHEETYIQRYQSRKKREKATADREELRNALITQESLQNVCQTLMDTAEDEDDRRYYEGQYYAAVAEADRIRKLMKGGG